MYFFSFLFCLAYIILLGGALSFHETSVSCSSAHSSFSAARSFDLVSLAYVCHESTARAIIGLVKEAFQVLRTGATIALTDNSPKSKVLQELSSVSFTLMKSTEPFLDKCYMLDLEETMRLVGFVNVCSILTDASHCDGALLIGPDHNYVPNSGPDHFTKQNLGWSYL